MVLYRCVIAPCGDWSWLWSSTRRNTHVEDSQEVDRRSEVHRTNASESSMPCETPATRLEIDWSRHTSISKQIVSSITCRFHALLPTHCGRSGVSTAMLAACSNTTGSQQSTQCKQAQQSTCREEAKASESGGCHDFDGCVLPIHRGHDIQRAPD